MQENISTNSITVQISINYIPSIHDFENNLIHNLHVSHLPPYKKINLEKITNEYQNICQDICTICYELFSNGQYYRKLPNCKHIYHKKCIDKWFKNDINMKCPNCRISYAKDK